MNDSIPAADADWRAQPHAIVERDGVRYTLLGTAHVSRASVDAVREAIADLHALNFIHRDIKPANFCVGHEVNKSTLK